MTPAAHAPLIGIRSTPLSVDEALDAVADPKAGAVAVFIGTVRDHDGGREGVTALNYTAHPNAVHGLQEIADVVAALPGVCGVAAMHRVGELAIGDRAVVCAVSAEHRGQAFDGARQLIEECKAQVPIWKQQHFAEGDHTWVGL
ncbi:MAG: molybdenum cofactor biosynthesis protein MoaE [Ornithinimicrobium sp.]